MLLRPDSPQRSLLPFYAVALVSEIVWVAIVPLAPAYADRLDLSTVETGAVLAAAGFATLVVSLPVGVLADRVGTRLITLASAALVALSSLAQAVSFDFWSLLVSRAAFGVALGAIWTAGLAWLAEAGANRERPSALGVPVTIAGIGFMTGPAFAGLTASALGLRAPFIALAGAAALAALAFSRTTSHETSFRQEHVTAAFSAIRRDRIVLASCVVMAFIGLMNGGVNLLAPLELGHNGFSSGETGLVLSGSSAVFVAVSIVITRLGTRAVTVRAVGLAALLYGGTTLLVTAGTSSVLIIAFLLGRAPFWSAISTLAYPLGARGALRADVGRGAIMGLLNFVWGLASTVGPVLAGALAEAAGERTAFACLVGLAALVGIGLLTAGEPVADVSAALASGAPGGFESRPEVLP